MVRTVGKETGGELNPRPPTLAGVCVFVCVCVHVYVCTCACACACACACVCVHVRTCVQACLRVN